jgi:hypothetical protein
MTIALVGIVVLAAVGCALIGYWIGCADPARKTDQVFYAPPAKSPKSEQTWRRQ